MKNSRASLTKSKVGLTKTIEYEGRVLSYSLFVNRRLKHLYITIDPIKGVIVKSPFSAIDTIETLLLQKASWILSKLHAAQERTHIGRLLETEGKILYLGEAILLSSFQTPELFYKEKTPPLVNRLVEEWSFLMGVKPTKVSFRQAKKRWGSCSYRNELSFNLSLAQLPLECIAYIVVHELAHITHKHHQKAFWECVASFMPEYKNHEITLKKFSPSLI
ncbi:MAG: M48 family peptidase [Epsilonproteobacteria bacterium]|nr:M48 family peptidase [Campylobacterota bacterium]